MKRAMIIICLIIANDPKSWYFFNINIVSFYIAHVGTLTSEEFWLKMQTLLTYYPSEENGIIFMYDKKYTIFICNGG